MRQLEYDQAVGGEIARDMNRSDVVAVWPYLSVRANDKTLAGFDKFSWHALRRVGVTWRSALLVKEH